MYYDDSNITHRYASLPVILTALLGEGGIRWGAALPLSLVQQHRQAPLAEGTTGATSDLRAGTHGWVATSLTLLLHRQTAPEPNMHLVSAGFANHQSNMLPLRTAPQLNRRPDAERSPSWYNSCSKCGEQGIIRFTNPQDRIRTPAPIPASMLHRQLPP
jgi:hypothetical protein